MLRASITFFILGIVSMLLGINSIAGLSIEIGKILLIVFLILSVVSFLVGRSRGKVKSLMAAALLATGLGVTSIAQDAQADDSVAETAKEVGSDTKRATTNAVNSVKDKTCKLVKGKMECAVQKTKHGVQKGAGKVEDAID